MKGGLKPQGFTIVETLIFLAVSGGLFISVFSYISGRQESAEFAYGVQEFATRISDITNDVSTGYYDKVGDFSCISSGAASPPVISTGGTTEQGTNESCIFLGRVIQFDPEGVPGVPEDQGYTVYSVVGRRTIGTGSIKREAQNLAESHTVPIASNFGHDATVTSTIPNGINVKWFKYATSEGALPSINTGAVGIFTNFGVYNLSGGATTGQSNSVSVRNVQILPVTGTTLDTTIDSMATAIFGIAASPLVVPKGGVTACLESPSSKLHAYIVIGGNVRQVTTDIEIITGPC